MKFTIMRLHHSASIQKDQTGDNQSVTWWSRDCFADREATILLDSNDAERLLHNADLYTRPRNLNPRPCTATLDGCGVGTQPSCIARMVERSNDTARTAAVATACLILGLNMPGNRPAQATEARIDPDAEMQQPWKYAPATGCDLVRSSDTA